MLKKKRVKDAKFENESELAFILERVESICGMLSQCHAQRKGKVPWNAGSLANC